jgi:uncharacterized repeat protein (TIGR01451 family)
VTITTNGPDPLTITQVALGGANPGDFVLSAPVTPVTIPAGASLVAAVRFDPTAGGARAATLLVTDNGFHSPQSASLTGTGNANADLELSLGGSPNPVKNGANLTYTITVKNGGPALATGIAVSDALPAGTVFASATTTQGSCLTPAPNATGVMTCDLGNLASGSKASIKLVVNVIATGKNTVTNTASVSSASPDPNPANNSATLSTNVFGSHH